jgi:hypothetical protein
MGNRTIDISAAAREKLRELAKLEHSSTEAVLDRALEAYRRQLFFEQANAAYAALRSNPEEWKSELEERALWDVTLTDGLDDE